MCDTDGCDVEPVVFVDIVFPADAEIDASTDETSLPNPVGSQRIGLCVMHAFEHGLSDPLVTGRAVRGLRAKGRFPSAHALAADWSWTVN